MINQLKYWDGAKPGLKLKLEVSREVEEDQARKKEKSKANEANRVRPLTEGWKKDRPCLVFDYKNSSMTCSVCIEVYGNTKVGSSNLKSQHTFLTGCTNRRVSAVTDNETSKYHLQAVERTSAKQSTDKEVKKSNADFRVDDIRALCSHYEKTLEKLEFDTDEALSEWRMMKIVLHKRNGTELAIKSWADVYDSNGDFRNIYHIIDLLLTLPPTSVSCETTFSQMKLVKTSRLTRLSTSTLNSLLLVKLESPPVEKYDPEAAIDKWMASAVKRRRTDYQQKPKKAHVDLVDIEPEVVIDMAPEEAVEADNAADAPGSEEEELELDVEFLNSICDDGED